MHLDTPTERNEPLAAFLSARDVDCPACGYNLRGLTSDRCPECCHQLVISVTLADPPVVQFVLAMVGLAACGVTFGMGLLVVLTISLVEDRFPRRDEAVMLLWAPAIILAVDAAAFVLFLRPGCRRWFRSRSKFRRRIIVLGCWGISLAVLGAWVFALLRIM